MFCAPSSLLLPFLTNLQNRTGSDLFSPDKIRHVQFRHVVMSACRHDGMSAFRHVGMLACRHVAEGGFSVTNLGNLDRIRHDQGWLAER